MIEVRRIGRGPRLATYALCLVMVLSGPGFLALGIMLDADLWAVILIAVVLSLVLVPLGVVMWSDVRRTARRVRRLAARGVEGTAEVLAVTPMSDDERLELRLSVGAPGVDPFEVVHSCDDDAELTVGSVLGAVVDPDGRLYAIG